MYILVHLGQREKTKSWSIGDIGLLQSGHTDMKLFISWYGTLFGFIQNAFMLQAYIEWSLGIVQMRL